MSFSNDLQSYIQNQNIVLQSEQSLKESEDQAEQQKIQMEMARDEAGGQIAMGSILPIDMASRISGMKNFAKRLTGIKDVVDDNDALKNVKGWAKKKLGFKDTDGDEKLDPDAIKMQPIKAEDFEEPTMETREVKTIGRVDVTRISRADVPVQPKTRNLFGDADDWMSGGDQALSSARARVEAMPSSVDWEDVASNTADYTPPLRETYSPATLADMARESRQMSAEALRSSAEKGLGTREPEQSFKYSGITQGESEFQRGIKSDLSDAFAERQGFEPIASEGASGVVLPDFEDLAGGSGVVRGFGERFGGGVESGMARTGEQRGSSMLADVMRAEASAEARPSISAGARFRSMPSAWERPARRVATTGEELTRQAGMEVVPEIRPTIQAPRIQVPEDIGEITPVARRIPQFRQGGEAGDIADFPEGMQIPESLRTDIPDIPSQLPTIDTKSATSRLRSTLGGLGDDEDLDEEGGTGGSWLSSILPESFGEGLGTGLAVIGLGAELYTGITTIKDAFKESHLIGVEQGDINRESQAIYNRPTFDFGQQAISNRDSGLGESSFNHF